MSTPEFEQGRIVEQLRTINTTIGEIKALLISNQNLVSIHADRLTKLEERMDVVTKFGGWLLAPMVGAMAVAWVMLILKR